MDNRDIDVTLCPTCYCMTKTIEDTCGKCGRFKYSKNIKSHVDLQIANILDDRRYEVRKVRKKEKKIMDMMRFEENIKENFRRVFGKSTDS